MFIEEEGRPLNADAVGSPLPASMALAAALLGALVGVSVVACTDDPEVTGRAPEGAGELPQPWASPITPIVMPNGSERSRLGLL
jgi:hypothetical protein